MEHKEKMERKLLQLMEIQLQIVENLYKDVQALIDHNTTKQEKRKIVRNVSGLKMNINSSSQKVVVTMKAQIKKSKEIIEQKYGIQKQIPSPTE